eukprot:TRINITY_DN15093_c0_g1_i1.p1 TRINITY_DN15093_c0_g1~~TRINITY_DN15093_c0_g1_i1.p1  ORF type:complete len:287 (-),score=73.70 TRINITY_DN15093_c0_g1_i1:93-953(-)
MSTPKTGRKKDSSSGNNKDGDETPSLRTSDSGSKLAVNSSDRSLFRSIKAELARLNASKQTTSGGSGSIAIKNKEKAAREKLQKLFQKFEQDSYVIIYDIMPTKINKLEQMFNEDKHFNASLEDLSTDFSKLESSGSKSVPCNKYIVDLEDALKHEILEMSEYMNTLSIWVQLNVPRIQDGNNFGVEVQSEIVSVLEAAGESGYGVLGGFTEYHIARGGIISKILKHPGIEDYKRAVVELDEKFYVKTGAVVLDLRNSYLLLFDMVSKNISKLESPRGSGPPSFIY